MNSLDNLEKYVSEYGFKFHQKRALSNEIVVVDLNGTASALMMDRIQKTGFLLHKPLNGQVLEYMESQVDSWINDLATKSLNRDQIAISRNVERNVLVNSFFARARRILYMREIRNRYKHASILVDKETFIETQRSVNSVGHKFCRKAKVLWLVSLPKFLIWFCVNKVLSIGVTHQIESQVVLHTYLSSQIEASGTFRDIYFENLFETLKRKRIKTSYLLSGYKYFPRRIIKRMNSTTFINEFYFYSFRDFLTANFRLLKMAQCTAATHPNEDAELQNLWDQHHQIQLTEVASLWASLRTKLLRTIESAEPCLRLVITEYEGMIFESALRAGLHESQKKSITFWGIQHNHLYPGLRSIVPIPVKNSVLPHSIYFMGQIYRSKLEKYFEGKVSTGFVPAFRFQHLLQRENISIHNTGKWVLVGSIKHSEEIELLKLVKKFRMKENIHYLPHPHLGKQAILRILDESRWSGQVLWRSSIGSTLRQYQNYIGKSSGGLLEALFSGKNVVQISMGEPFSLNPLEGLERYVLRISSSDNPVLVKDTLNRHKHTLQSLPVTEFFNENDSKGDFFWNIDKVLRSQITHRQ